MRRTIGWVLPRVHVGRRRGTWTLVAVGERLTSPPLWTGSELVVYDGGTLRRSADGSQWTATSLGEGVGLGPVARSPEGTFVAANTGWPVRCEQRRFYRSEDGAAWETLAADAFVGGHRSTSWPTVAWRRGLGARVDRDFRRKRATADRGACMHAVAGRDHMHVRHATCREVRSTRALA